MKPMPSANSAASSLPLITLEHLGSEMGRRIQAFDWSTTPLGPISFWPQSLRTVVNILLTSRYSMWMAWGNELTMLYNDAYRPTLGLKHPRALGSSASEVWAEIWPDIGPRIQSVLSSGKATYDEALLLFLERSGFSEETYHTFSYSPLADDDGRISGMLCVVTEETERIVGERRVQTLRDVASGLSTANTEAEVLRALKTQLNQNQKDLPFTLTYFFSDSGDACLACSSGFPANHPLAPDRMELHSDFPWPVRQAFDDTSPRFIKSLAAQSQVASLPTGSWSKAPEQAALVPIKRQGQDEAAGVFIVGANPHSRYDAAYSGFISLLAGQIAAALANARSYDAERRRAEALAEIDRAKTTFFSNVSHELRTPLTLLLSPVEELLANRLPDRSDSSSRELLELVHRNGLRLQKLVNALLDFSRIEAGRMQAIYEPTDLSHFTAELAAGFQSAVQKANLAFTIDCEPLPAPVYVDREMWEKVVLNLLSNALKFTFKGGVRVVLKANGPLAELAVQDSGIGIPPSEIPQIFDRFHQVSGSKGRTMEGTGIGLALVQELVNLHGGSIQVDSEVEQGTTFKISIPFGTEHLPKEKLRATSAVVSSGTGGSAAFLAEALRWFPDDIAELDPAASATTPAAAPLATRPANAPKEQVLLVDDNADIRQYVARLLNKKYEVVTATNGEEALVAAKAKPPDLILSDVMMPGVDGFQLLDKLRGSTETRTIPVILLSARAGEESRVEGLGAGADDYLVKPFTARELLARVEAHLSMSRRRKEAEQALRQVQMTLQSFYDSCPFAMGVVEVDDGRVWAVYCNSATAKFFGEEGQSVSDLTGKELVMASDTHEFWVRQFNLSQGRESSIRFEYEHPRPGGECWLSACVTYLGLSPNDRPRFSFIAEEVTDRKKNDDLLRHSNEELRQANSDLEQFAYSASHDLQEPLRQIAIYSQLLEKRFAATLDGKASQYLGYCIEGAHRMEMLISDLLAYSQAARTSSTTEEFVDTNQILETVKKNLATSIEETAAEITTSDLPVVRGDAVPLVHLFQNLVSNALKYRSKRTPALRISAVRNGDLWRFSVEDNGIGIPKEFQTQIFGIFKRLHDRAEYPGTGIGLAICQKIVERYGGRIWVESQPGLGSTFLFTLPA